MNKYVKIINGDKVVLPSNQIIVHKDGRNWCNPTEKMILADGWMLYEPEPIQPKSLNEIKEDKINEILSYDSSVEVNEFHINGISVWLDKSTRAGLMLRFQSELALKKQTTTLWYDNMSFELQLNDAMSMLYLIENYASQCYDNTQLHIAAINDMDNAKDVEDYNFMEGYPNKLEF